jgi:hypothetical protein
MKNRYTIELTADLDYKLTIKQYDSNGMELYDYYLFDSQDEAEFQTVQREHNKDIRHYNDYHVKYCNDTITIKEINIKG